MVSIDTAANRIFEQQYEDTIQPNKTTHVCWYLLESAWGLHAGVVEIAGERCWNKSTWMEKYDGLEWVGRVLLIKFSENCTKTSNTRGWRVADCNQLGSLRWPESSLWCRRIGTDSYDGLGDSVSSGLGTRRRINRFYGNMIRWRSRASLESLCCRLEMARGCRGGKLKRTNMNGLMLWIKWYKKALLDEARCRILSSTHAASQINYSPRLLCQSSTRQASPGGWQFWFRILDLRNQPGVSMLAEEIWTDWLMPL